MIIELTPEDKKALKTALVFGCIDTEKVPTLKKLFENPTTGMLEAMSDEELTEFIKEGIKELKTV